MTNDRLLTEREAAAYLNLKPNTLTVWRCTGRNSDLVFVSLGPERVIRYRKKDGSEHSRVARGAIRYRLSDLQAWVNNHFRSGT